MDDFYAIKLILLCFGTMIGAAGFLTALTIFCKFWEDDDDD